MQYVITLVHGTWPNGLPVLAWVRRLLWRREPARWTDPDSDLTHYLAERLAVNQVRPIVLLFRWSGGNSVSARVRAAEAIAAHLSQIAAKFPCARQIVIGHSHGGSVLMYALRRPGVAELIAGVVCLATPFIHLLPKPKDAPRGPIFLFLGLPILLLMIYAEVYPSGLSIVLMLAAGYLVQRYVDPRMLRLVERLHQAAERVRVACELPGQARAPTLLIRGDGDEASSILTSASLVASITTRPWLRLYAWAKAPERRNQEEWNKYMERWSQWKKQGKPGRPPWKPRARLFQYAQPACSACSLDQVFGSWRRSWLRQSASSS